MKNPKSLKRLSNSIKEEKRQKTTLTCNEEIKQKISGILEKYGWSYSYFEKFFHENVGISAELEKEISPEDLLDISGISKQITNNHLVFSNREGSIRIHFLELKFLEIIVIKDNKVLVYDIEEWDDGNNEIQGKIRAHTETNVVKGMAITFKAGKDYIEETLCFPINNELKVNIKSEALVHSDAAVLKIREELEKLLADTEDINYLKSEIYDRIQKNLDLLNFSESTKDLVHVTIVDIFKEDGYKITCIKEENKFFNNNSIIIETAKDSISTSTNNLGDWKYTCGNVVIEHTETSANYRITCRKEKVSQVNDLIERAEEMSKLLDNISW